MIFGTAFDTGEDETVFFPDHNCKLCRGSGQYKDKAVCDMCKGYAWIQRVPDHVPPTWSGERRAFKFFPEDRVFYDVDPAIDPLGHSARAVLKIEPTRMMVRFNG